MNKDEMIIDEDEIVESMKTYERARQETAREILLQVERDYVLYPVLTVYEILDRVAESYGIDWGKIHEYNI